MARPPVHFIAAFALLAAPPAPAVADEGEALDAEAIRAELVGRPLKMLSAADEIGAMRYRPDGRAEIALPARGLAETGGWRIEADRLCHAFPRATADRERCFAVRKVGEGKYVTGTGALFWY